VFPSSIFFFFKICSPNQGIYAASLFVGLFCILLVYSITLILLTMLNGGH
jgi:hypothetical protein